MCIIASELGYIELTKPGQIGSVTIPQGSLVRFTNKRSVEVWPASNVHPTHKNYPGSDITKCGTLEQSQIFDSCIGMSTDSITSFTFNELGTWQYHDHLHPNVKGTIVVQ